MDIKKLLETDKSLELYGMSPDTLVELMGMSKIAQDQVEDLQYYIDQAYFEAKALERECAEEFGFTL